MKKQKYRKLGKRLLAGLLCVSLMFGEFGLSASAEKVESAEKSTVVTTESDQTEENGTKKDDGIKEESASEESTKSEKEELSTGDITEEETQSVPEENKPNKEDSFEEKTESTVPEEEKTETETSSEEGTTEVSSEESTSENGNSGVEEKKEDEDGVEEKKEKEKKSLFQTDKNFPNVVYVGTQHGSNIESAALGKTPEYPYLTLEEAYDNVENEGIIKVVDSLDVSSWPEEANKNVTIEGWKGEIGGTSYNNPTILMDGDWILKGDTIFQRLTIKQKTTGNKVVYPEGHRLQIGSGEEEAVAGQSGVAPRVEDTYIKDIKNRTDRWFVIGTNPADEENGEHIEKVDIRVYGVQSWIAIKADAKNANDQTYAKVTTPNLKSICIEVIGNTKNNAMLAAHSWYNGMAPAFNGGVLEDVKITLGYGNLGGTYSLFRTYDDRKGDRKGSFSMNYTLDNITVNGGEAIVFGEAYTTGDITIDLWKTKFNKSSRSSFALGTGGGQFGTVWVNLHDSSLTGLGNHYSIQGGRNGLLSYDKFILTLENSHITDYTAFQDEMEVIMSGESSIGRLCYYPKTASGTQTKCVVKNTGKGTLGFIEKNPIEIENQSGAELALANTTSNINDVKNNGAIHIEQSQNWQGNYTGGTEDDPGNLILLTGTTLDIKGEVSGKTTALAKETESASKIAAITAESGKAECITWENGDGVKTEEEGYWAINLGKQEHNQRNCIYIRYSGSDNNNGTSYQNAVKSFHKAYELAVKKNKKIVVCDGYHFYDECVGGHSEQAEVPVIVTTNDGETDFEQVYGAKLMIATESSTNSGKEGMSLKHSFQFEDITITGTSPAAEKEYLEIYANGHPTVMGSEVRLIPYTSVYGGSVNGEVTNTKLTILDGIYFRIYGGNCAGKVKGKIELTVNNAEIRTPGYGSEFAFCIVGGSRGGSVDADIDLNVSADKEKGQEITGVKRILGGNYTGYLTGDIKLNVSGAVNFDENVPNPVKNAIIGGNFSSGDVTGNVTMTVQDIEGTGTPYIVGGNGMTYRVVGNVSLTVDGVQAYRIVGGSGWTNPSGNVANSKVTGAILMNIGLQTPVQADSIYGCGGDMGHDAPAASNKEYKPESMTMNLGQVSAGVVSGGIIGVSVSDETRKVLSLGIQNNTRIRELKEFSSVVVNDGSTLTYDGTTLTSDTLENNGTIQYQEGSVSVNSDYKAGENARIKLNSHTTVTHEKAVSGKTKVSSMSGNRALTVRAFTEKIEGLEEEKEQVFVSENADKPLLYSLEENMSVWKYDPIGVGTRDFVYVDGQKGNDEWDGTKPQQAKDGTAGEGGEEITSGPVKTLERAYEMIKDGGSIIICGKTEISGWPNIQKEAFITSDAGLVEKSQDTTDYREGNADEQGAENTGLFFNPGTGNKYLLLEDDLTLRNLDFHYEYKDKNGGIDANGNKLIIGDKKDTYTGVTDVQPDVCFYKIQDGKRVKPDTFLLVGGGLTRKTLEQIYLEIYNTEVKAVIGLWGGSTETDQRTVNGNVNLILQDCKTSNRIHYCSNDTFVDSTDTNQYSGGYGVINGDANVSIAFYNNNMPNTLPGSLCGLKRVKNMKTGTLHYLNATRHTWQMGVTTTAGMFHAADKCNIIYESNGTGDIRFDTIYPVDSNTTLDGGENSQVEVTFLGKITIYKSALIGGNTKSLNLSVILNLGNEERGSENILFANSKQLVNQSNTNAYNLKSYHINYYPGANVKFDMAAQSNVTTEADGRPVVVLHSLKSDVDVKKQTEYIIDEPDFVGGAVLECDNVKVTSSINMGEGDKQLDLRLINGAGFTYDKDDFALNGSLTMEAGTQLGTNGSVSIEKDLNLKANAIFPVENFLTVEGKISSEENASLLVNNEANAFFGGASGETRVDYNGTAGKGYFLLQATKGDTTESYAEKCFVAGMDKQGTEIKLTYDDTQSGYVTWTYGKQEPLNEIFLDQGRGSDTNSGSRPGQAVKTFARALKLAAEKIKAAKADEQKQVQIVISGKYAFEKEEEGAIFEDLAAKLADAEIIVTQKADSLGTVYRSEVSVESGFEIPCSLIFQDIKLTFSGAKPELYAGGKALTIGENVTVQAEKDYPSIYGGHETETVIGDTNLTIYSGTWFRVYGGGKSGVVTGDTQVTLGDSLIKSAPDITTGTEHDNFSSTTTDAVFGGGKEGNVEGISKVVVNYGEDYGYIFGGSETGGVKDTEITVDHKDVKIQRIYGGSFSGNVTGKAQVNFKSGSANRIYGGCIEDKTSVASTEVNIGQKGKSVSSATVKDYLRGSGDRGGVTEDAVLNIMDGAVIEETCKVAAGGYTGGVKKSILNISGGEVQTDIYAGGAGEFKVQGGNILDEIDPTKGIVSASEVNVTGGTVLGSVYGGGNMGSVGIKGTKAGEVLTTANITNGIIQGDFYGGGSLAPTYGNIEMSLEMSGDAKIGGGAFGGGKGRVVEGSKSGIAANVEGTTTVTVNGAHAITGIYGGCNLNGNVKSTQVNVVAPTDCHIYGGGLGAETYVETTKVDLNLRETVAAEPEETVASSVYGGGDQGQTGTSHVNVQNWNGDVYGGGRGSAEEEGILTSAKNVFRVIGNAGAELFTGQKPFVIDGLKDAHTKETHVTISGHLTGNAYGGGELATVGSKPNTNVTSTDENTIKPVTNVVIGTGASVTGNVYGGGKGRENREFAKIYGDTSVQMQDGEVSQGVQKESDNGSIFGGGEIAPVEGNTNVTVIGGSVYNVFGGNDRSGNITGHTNVTIQADEATEKANAQNIYGGGRNAAYNGTGTKVLIESGKVENAYGGGYGESAVCSNTSLTIHGGQTKTAFAGGNAATVSKEASVTVKTPKEEQCVETLFAGNNKAAMTIQPAITLTSGQINTFYGGGNQGDMTVKDGLKYGTETFGSENISIDTVYGGCNSADVTGGVTLELTNGTYKEVYGGNNVNGQAHMSQVILNGDKLHITTVYGGGNRANIANTSVKALKGTIDTIYGGGNQATATESVNLAVGDNTTGSAKITNVYCGNNQAVMDLAPTIDLQQGTIESFYGGGNQGAMEPKEGKSLSYSFDSEKMNITTVYGGGHEADVKGKVSLTLGETKITEVYGGCNKNGQVDTSEVIVRGSGATTIYGGGKGGATQVETANVQVQNGTVAGNIYGGSGYGKVKTSHVTAKEDKDTDRIVLQKSVYGGGYGESSVVEHSNVTIDMKLDIASQNDDNADLIVEEAKAESATDPENQNDAPSGETRTDVSWKGDQEKMVSVISGSVYGGGDMGKVGDGHINQSANTADIDVEGKTKVQVKSGHIKGSVFGGGSGTPAENLPYTAYMGTVFGSCAVDITGGYVEGSIYGCGHQSRVYAPQDTNAAVVHLSETSDSKIIIGTSVFGGGNKGEGNAQNASVYTVIGDTEVNISGVKGKKTSTAIYFLSDSKGGVYGDGNLCLVNGERTVNLTDFNYGTDDKGLLKTFYSLQRADEVNLTRSRVVLKGAKDLVDETANDTEYAINRVGQLNMKESSALKLTTVVHLLGGLSSDQNMSTTYIDRGNNGENKYTNRGGEVPSGRLTEHEIDEYRKAYLDFLGKEDGAGSSSYSSFNVVCVANGSYLEIKKSDTEYGDVKGLFTLELLHANPGEGGGFVYAEIGSKETPGSTGDFICTTPNEKDTKAEYMEVKDTVGGYTNHSDSENTENGQSGDYTYYYWYIKGGKYSYKTNLKGYIGTTETEFETAVNLMTLTEDYHYILNSVTGPAPVEEENSSNRFCKSKLKDHWSDEKYGTSDFYAIEVRVVPGGTGADLEEKSIGFLSYGTYGEEGKECWGIKKADGKVITGTGDENTSDQESLKENDVYQVLAGTTGLSLQFVLHKGTGVTTEFKDAPVVLTFDVLKGRGDGYDPGTGGENAHLTVNTQTSITRLVPTQAAYIGSGRLYAGVSSDIPVNITKNSAFTAQFITKFVPSAFNTDTLKINEVLTTDCNELYLLDETSGIGFTAVEKDGQLKLTYATEGAVDKYTLKKEDGVYKITYADEEGKEVTHPLTLANEKRRRDGTEIPKGTVITLVAQIDDHAPTYWYYYVEKNTTTISLNDFYRMGSKRDQPADQYSFENASSKKISPLSSNRVTENLTFVFDFSNVTEETTNVYPDWNDGKGVSGALRLKHQTTINSTQNVDIMDYVSTSSYPGQDGVVTTHTREYPAVSNTFEVSKDKTGIKKFAVEMEDQKEHTTKDVYEIGITIEEDEDFINTQYEEREYAVVLQQMGDDGAIPFPAGTLFRYQGESLIAGNQNLAVIIPVKKAGSHEVEIETTLEGFEEGPVHLKATLYSSSVASYYNGLETREESTMQFDVEKRPEAAIKVTAGNRKQILTEGKEISLTISSISPESGSMQENPSGTVEIYRYERKSDSYQKIFLTNVFTEDNNSFLAKKDGVEWQSTIKTGALPGTYRLEFQYEDKTEYWDFVVKE